MTAPAASVVVEALERAWEAVRCRHPDVPAVVVVVAAGSDARAKGRLKLGHFAASRWHLKEQTALAEVLVGGEGLRRGPVDVLGTLLHEAAHGLAQARSVKDTSRGGRFHNRRYRELAEELGLEVAEVAPIGWSATTVPDPLADRYRQVLDDLAAALVLWRVAEPTTTGASTSRNGMSCTCPCGRRIRVSVSTHEEAPIICGACGDSFTAGEPEG